MPVWSWLAKDPQDEVRMQAHFKGWDVRYYFEKEEPVAAALLNGTEIHFIVAPAWRRRLIRKHNTQKFLDEIREERGGMLTTRILHESFEARHFVQRVGFEKTWSDERFDYFALCGTPLVRKQP